MKIGNNVSYFDWKLVFIYVCFKCDVVNKFPVVIRFLLFQSYENYVKDLHKFNDFKNFLTFNVLAFWFLRRWRWVSFTFQVFKNSSDNFNGVMQVVQSHERQIFRVALNKPSSFIPAKKNISKYVLRL